MLPVLATLLGRLTTLLARLLEWEPGMARRCGSWRPSRRLGFAGGDTDDEVEVEEEGPTSDTVLLAAPATLPPPRLLRRGPAAEKEEEAERLPAPPPPPSTMDESRKVATLEPLACCGCSGGVLRGGWGCGCEGAD